MIINSDFKPAWWLSNAHAQTIYPTLLRWVKAPVDLNERLELPDGDFIDLAWAINGQSNDTPLVVILHGLGGNIDSTYVAGFMQAINNCGWRAVLMHFRGASHEPNRLPRAYHSGDTADLNYFLHILVEREPHTPKAIVGVSLGGNVLLKWLGETGAQKLIKVAIAISVPFQIRLVANRVGRGISRLYQAYLLRRLKTAFQKKIKYYQYNLKSSLPEPFKDIQKCRCVWTFDEFITAPLNGFPHVHAYYRETSSRQYLQYITTPTLIIHALDDPFMTPDIVPQAHELSSLITLEISANGGHVGFIAGNIPGVPIYWLESRVQNFLKTVF